jgi:hypothetical protein
MKGEEPSIELMQEMEKIINGEVISYDETKVYVIEGEYEVGVEAVDNFNKFSQMPHFKKDDIEGIKNAIKKEESFYDKESNWFHTGSGRHIGREKQWKSKFRYEPNFAEFQIHSGYSIWFVNISEECCYDKYIPHNRCFETKHSFYRKLKYYGYPIIGGGSSCSGSTGTFLSQCELLKKWCKMGFIRKTDVFQIRSRYVGDDVELTVGMAIKFTYVKNKNKFWNKYFRK